MWPDPFIAFGAVNYPGPGNGERRGRYEKNYVGK